MFILLLLVLTYSIQFIWLFKGLTAFHRVKHDYSLGHEYPVSIVIAAHNEEQHLPVLLKKIFEQDYPLFEVIVVDDRSVDHTSEILRKFQQSNDQLSVVTIQEEALQNAPKKYALTQGIQQAQYEHLVLTDADCVPATNQWLKEMVKPYTDEQKEIVLGVGRYFKEMGWLNLFVRYETLITGMQYLSAAVLGKAYMGVGRNLSYKKSLFQQYKFSSHEKLISGDDDLFVNQAARPKNVSIVTKPEAHTFSFSEPTFKRWFRQKTRHLSVGNSYKPSSKLILGLIFVSHIGVYFLSLVLVIKNCYLLLGLSLFLLRTLGLIVVISKTSRQWQEDIPKTSIVVLDFLHLMYQLILGATALFSKRASWS